jgi:hypothetical protein
MSPSIAYGWVWNTIPDLAIWFQRRYRLVARGLACLMWATNMLEPLGLGIPEALCHLPSVWASAGFQIHSQRVQPILKPSFVWLVYYLMYYINTKLWLPKYHPFTLHLYRSQTKTSYHLQTLHQFKYQHQLALRYFNLYNLC